MSYKESRSSPMDHYQQQNHSFSSSLLEEIYRSFDNDDDNCNVISYRKSSSSSSLSSRNNMKNVSSYLERDNKFYVSNNNNHHLFTYEDDRKVNIRRTSRAEVHSNGKLKFSSSSSTSSSDSSSGIGGFSSSENESLHRGSSNSKSKSKLKPIRTSFDPPEFRRKSYSDEIPAKKKSGSHGSTKEGNLQKRALKLYGDLKKVKQPISPGGKLASFLNSLFNSTASKKPKISSSSSVMTSSLYGEKLSTMSTPSTASSYARSCLSKTPSSAGRFERRSVRFCPVNTVISTTDNISECNAVRKENYNDNEELKAKIMEKQRRVEEVAKELLKNYHHGRKYNQNDVVNMMNESMKNNNSYKDNNSKIRSFEVEDEDEDDEDDVSCCSSDLFELENLLDVGVDRRYRQELPVYETTHVDTNRAIANGFIL